MLIGLWNYLDVITSVDEYCNLKVKRDMNAPGDNESLFANHIL